MAHGMEFGEWLGRQLRRRGLSQAELAAELGVSRAAVSAWVSGRVEPRIDKLQAIQVFLGFQPGPAASQVDAADSSSDLVWHPRPAHPDGGRELGNAAAFAFEPDLAVLAREATQNSLDERVLRHEPVRVRYVLDEISGEHLERFLDAVRWDEIEPHIEAAASPNQKVARVLRHGLSELRSKGRLLLLRIDDYNASGLTGDEYEDGRFAAVVRRQLDSRKTGTAGGTYGLGKATLWAASSFGLVLINSTLSEPYGGRSERRLIGRLDLPWHRTSAGEEWAGPAWLGVQDAERETARSWWADRRITEDLHLTRASSAPGTSFLVVGVQESTSESGDLADMHRRLVDAIGRNFWAAMVAPGSGRPMLEASVAAFRDGEVAVPEEQVDPYGAEPSRSRALRAFYDGATVTAPTEPDAVVRSTVPLRVPRLRGDGGAEVTHEAVLLLTEAEEDEEKANRLVTMRGSRMVVADRKVTDVPMGAPRFQAVLLAGRAVGASDDAEAAERFLRTAEPPDHDDWRKTDDLVATYARGAISRIGEFGQAMTAEIRKILRRPAPNSRDEGPAELRELLDLTPTAPSRSPGYPIVESLEGEILDDGAWKVRVAVKLPRREDPWALVPVLRFVTRSGPKPEAGWARLEAESGCEVAEDRRLIFPPGSRTGSFVGETEVTSHPVVASMAAVEVELRRTKEAA